VWQREGKRERGVCMLGPLTCMHAWAHVHTYTLFLLTWLSLSSQGIKGLAIPAFALSLSSQDIKGIAIPASPLSLSLISRYKGLGISRPLPLIQLLSLSRQTSQFHKFNTA